MAERKKQSGTDRMTPPARRRKKRAVREIHAHSQKGQDGRMRRRGRRGRGFRRALGAGRGGGRFGVGPFVPFVRCFFFVAGTVQR
jgi:hypothetical protein